jgi:hypothetical protein
VLETSPQSVDCLLRRACLELRAGEKDKATQMFNLALESCALDTSTSCSEAACKFARYLHMRECDDEWVVRVISNSLDKDPTSIELYRLKLQIDLSRKDFNNIVKTCHIATAAFQNKAKTKLYFAKEKLNVCEVFDTKYKITRSATECFQVLCLNAAFSKMYKYTLCNSSFERKDHLKRHMFEKQDERKAVKEVVCKKGHTTFVSSNMYSLHKT